MGVGYNCETCQLYFYLGSHVSWDLDGCSQSRVCRCCGTMHSIQHPKNGADTVSAQAGPIIYDMINGDEERLFRTMDDPLLVCTVPTPAEVQNETLLSRRMEAIEYDNIKCNHCNAVGALELDWHVDDDLRNGMCPKCRETGIVAVFADSC